uniref:Uncharacterized protein n=1 Tax=Peronospora matthiolae TaxID=2874970 RepID=A0AAV1TJ64_9STRA
MPVCFLLFLLTLVVSVGSGAISAPVAEKLVVVSTPSKMRLFKLETDAIQTSLRVIDATNEERGGTGITVAMESGVTSLNSTSLTEWLRDVVIKVREMLSSGLEKFDDFLSAQWTASKKSYRKTQNAAKEKLAAKQAVEIENNYRAWKELEAKKAKSKGKDK